MKFTTSTSVKKVAKPMAKAVKLPSQTELRASYLNLCAVTGHLKEVDMLVDNMTMAIAALSRKDATAETIRVLNIDKGLESLLGVAEKTITKQMALEGLGQQLKAGWQAIVDFIVKCVKAVRDFIGKLFQTTGHMARTVKANIDKVDFNATVQVPSKADVGFLYDAVLDMYGVAGMIFAKLGKVDPAQYSKDNGVDWNAPFMKNLKAVCDRSHGFFVLDESTGVVSTNFSFDVKEQTLTEAGWNKESISKMSASVLPQCIQKLGTTMITVSQAIRNFQIDKVGAVAETVAGVVSQSAEEATANFIRSYKAWWNTAYSCQRAVMKGSTVYDRVIAQAYKTLPAELKKHI